MQIILLSLFLAMAPAGTDQAVSDHLTIKHDGKTLETVDRSTYAFTFFINESKLNQLMDNLDTKVTRQPEDAKLTDAGEIVSAKPGEGLDRKAFELAFRQFIYNGETAEMEVPLKRNYPRVDSELLSEIKENKIGGYVTQFKKSNQERTHNIKLSAKAIDNQVIFPGETFSFNKTLGERTEKKGYKRAPVIVKGEMAEDIGGGICQTSSTLYNAVDLKGIEIVERYSHSRSVPYVPSGRDATVSWWGPDFSFKNKRSQPVLIRAQAKDGKMEIKVYSSVAAK